MNLNLPPRGLLGELTLLEVFDLYEEPILFSCRSARGERYVGLLCASDDARQAWLYAPISPARLEELRSGRLTTYDLFREVEGGDLAYVSRSREASGSAGWSVEWVIAAEVDDALLPTPGVSLELEPEEARGEDTLPDLSALAAQGRRDVLALRLVLPDRDDHEAPASLVGAVLSGVQHVVNAIGQAVLARPTTRAPIPVSVLNDCQLSVTGVFAGSFGVTLGGAGSSDHSHTTKSGPIFEQLFKLLSVTQDPAALREQLGALGGRLPNKYRALLSTLGAVERFELGWGAPSGGPARRAALGRAEVATGVRVLTSYTTLAPQEFTVLARLIGLNLRTKSYELHDESEGARYVGRFVDAVSPAARVARLGELYFAVLQDIPEESAGGAVEQRQELLALAPAVD
ncbi:hypothetical protein L6R49_18980 [Myxococcota bacterium]|nr:hypothetical protein [Myxococcota bacterium]